MLAPSPITVVLFDWGNTLMIDDGSVGPMADRRFVEALPGAREVLRTLHSRRRLLVATNAEASDAVLVRRALARVGLDTFVDDVVTSREAGAAKPDPAFFQTALRVAFQGCEPEPRTAVMVGDSWENDIAGALAAGMRTVWFNPSLAARPAGSPSPDAQITTLLDLIAALVRMEENGSKIESNER